MAQDLRKLRKLKGQSIAQLAAKSGVAAQVIRDYEAGTRSISASHLQRLAKALYVDQWDINPRSTPPAQPAKTQRPRPPKKPRPKQPQPKQPLPARSSQIHHLLKLVDHLSIDRATIESEMGKPVEQLTRDEAKEWNKRLTQLAIQKKGEGVNRRRAHLPEGVDRFEMEYLDKVLEAGDSLSIVLFNGERFQGKLLGYSPYTLVILDEEGDELTVNKLAIAYYHRRGGER